MTPESELLIVRGQLVEAGATAARLGFRREAIEFGRLIGVVDDLRAAPDEDYLGLRLRALQVAVDDLRLEFTLHREAERHVTIQ
jgi:hypothetical protein